MGIGLDQYYKIEGFFQHSSVFGKFRRNFYGYGKNKLIFDLKIGNVGYDYFNINLSFIITMQN
jgi:hypothetical protein